MATGKELKNAIKGKGFTIEAAAGILGISRQTLSTHMGKAKIDSNLIKNVKDKLDISLSESKGDTQENYSVTELIKVIAQNAETIVRNSRTIDSQQEMIRDYAERERKAPDIIEVAKMKSVKRAE